MDKMRKKNWKLAAGILLIVQLLLAFVTIGIIIWLDLLPVVYLLLISLVFASVDGKECGISICGKFSGC